MLGVRGRAGLAASIATAVGFLAMSVTPAAAAPAAPATGGLSREELNPAARVKAPAAEQRDILTAEPPGPCPLSESPLKFTLKSVSFRGATALSPGQLADAYAGMIGQTLSVSEICEIRDRAT